MVGDALSDLKAASAAGINKLALVRTGRGTNQLKLPDVDYMPQFAIYEDLLDVITDL